MAEPSVSEQTSNNEDPARDGHAGKDCASSRTAQWGPSDKTQTVAAALAGDQEAFGQLVIQYQDRLFNTLLGLLGSREDASDVVQEAFVRAYVKLDSFRGESHFFTWLYRIAMNLARSHQRRAIPAAGRSSSLEQIKECGGSEPVDPGLEPQRAAMDREQIDELRRALGKLPELPRQILVLRELEDCSYDTIANILEIPVGTVRSRLFRARHQLRQLLQGMASDEG
jgi:RNA polymerase sigma-70 factor, ECF subfamily